MHGYDSPIALLPSLEAAGKIGDALQESGFLTVELENDQVSSGAGIKCRTLPLEWV